MKDIDFLPSRYCEQKAQRKAKLWHLGVVCLFGLTITAAAAGQYAVRRGLKRQVTTAAARRADAAMKFAQMAQLHKDLDAARDEAALCTYLRHPWPRTQMLAEVVRPLTDSLALTELTIVDEVPATATPLANAPAVAPPENEDAQPQLTAARRDLQQLRQLKDRRLTVITLSGITRDSGQLHSYVAQLGRSPLFQTAELESLESLSKQESGPEAASSFLIRVVVVPGYGQPGGPQLKPPADALAKDSTDGDPT